MMLEQAIENIKTKKCNFDESVDISIRLEEAEHVVGMVSLPNGTGKSVRVAVFAKNEKAKEATDAGADIVGGEDLAEKILKGEINFDRIISTPDMMGIVGRLGRILGPKGLMPNPKLGTVTFDVTKAVTESKAGSVKFKAEKAGVIHASVGRVSFPTENLVENIKFFIETVRKEKPIKKMHLSSTMGPAFKIEI